MDTTSAFILFGILAALALCVLIADIIIFIRWVQHRWAKYRWEENLQYLSASYAAERTRYAEATEGVVPGADWTPEIGSPDDYGDTQQTIPAAKEAQEPVSPFARTWSLVDAFLAFQFAFVLGQIVPLIALLPFVIAPMMFGPRGQGSTDAIFSPPALVIQCLGLFFMNGLFVGVVAFCIRRYGLSLADIGLRRPPPRLIVTGLVLGLVLFAGAAGAETMLGGILPHVLPKSVLDALVEINKQATAGGLFAKINSMPIKLLFALAGSVAAPIGEEIFFRGLLYNALKRRLTVPLAVVISGFLFALMHLSPLAIFVIFPMGMMLAYVYEKTRSLWVTIIIHCVNNSLAFILMMAFPHLGEAPPPSPHPAGPPARPGAVRTVPATHIGMPNRGIRADG